MVKWPSGRRHPLGKRQVARAARRFESCFHRQKAIASNARNGFSPGERRFPSEREGHPAFTAKRELSSSLFLLIGFFSIDAPRRRTHVHVAQPGERQGDNLEVASSNLAGHTIVSFGRIMYTSSFYKSQGPATAERRYGTARPHSSVGRALGSHPRGRRFEPCCGHQHGQVRIVAIAADCKSVTTDTP